MNATAQDDSDPCGPPGQVGRHGRLAGIGRPIAMASCVLLIVASPLSHSCVVGAAGAS